jgi:hypothetical protein
MTHRAGLQRDFFTGLRVRNCPRIDRDQENGSSKKRPEIHGTLLMQISMPGRTAPGLIR